MNIVTRDYHASDYKSMVELNYDLGYPTNEDDVKLRMETIMKLAHTKTIIAEINGIVAGYIGMSQNYSWEHNDCFVRIQALSVSKNYRRLGIGRLLIEKAAQWANELNAKSLVLNCGNRKERESAHKFYPSLGFESKSTGYKKEL